MTITHQLWTHRLFLSLTCLKNCLAEWMHFSSDVIVMGLLRKVNMLTYYMTEFVWTCFIKYVALNIVCMTFCLLYSASAMTCVIGLTRLYYPNVTVIYIRNLLLIIVCSKKCNHWYVHPRCIYVCCVYFNKLNWTEIEFKHLRYGFMCNKYKMFYFILLHHLFYCSYAKNYLRKFFK